MAVAFVLNRPVLVIGTGRCGTGHMAKRLGCGHEVGFGVHDGKFRVVRCATECSWMALPYVDQWREWNRNGVVLHLIRHPHRCLESLAGGPLLWDGRSPWSKFRQTWCVGSDVVEFYLNWWHRCTNAADLIIRVEDQGKNEMVNHRPIHKAVCRDWRVDEIVKEWYPDG